ncbi:MAG: clostripain-related cysteine peptidase [Acidobacteriota bacterium]
MPRQEASRPNQSKPWTVAVYMIADGLQGSHSLDAMANAAKKQIADAFAAAGVADDVDVAIQMDFTERPGTRRFILNRKPIRTSREGNAGDPAVLEDFLRWVRQECPARRYAVHFWGHSSGPVGLFFDKAAPGARPDGLTLAELGYAFERAMPALGRPADLLLLKDCWLSTLEAACELRDGARYLVASQSEVPIEGWPYKEIFESLTADDTRSVAAKVVDVLGDFYGLAANRGRFLEIPYAGVDVEAARGIDEPLRALAARLDTLRDGEHGPSSRLALRRAARADPALLDVNAMCANLGAIDDAEIRRHAAALNEAVAGSLIGRHPNPSIFQGLSVFYFPLGSTPTDKNSRIAPAFFRSDLDVVDDYETLELNRNTQWHRVALENFTPPLEGNSMFGDEAKSDSFAIDWSSNGDTLTITIAKKNKNGTAGPKAKAKPKPKRKAGPKKKK